MLKISPPAFGKSLDVDCATQQSDVVFLARIESRNVAYLSIVFAFFDQLHLVAGADLALLQHSKVEVGALAREVLAPSNLFPS